MKQAGEGKCFSTISLYVESNAFAFLDGRKECLDYGFHAMLNAGKPPFVFF